MSGQGVFECKRCGRRNNFGEYACPCRPHPYSVFEEEPEPRPPARVERRKVWDGFTVLRYNELFGLSGHEVPWSAGGLSRGFIWLICETERLRYRLGLEEGQGHTRIRYETVERLREEGYTIGSET